MGQPSRPDAIQRVIQEWKWSFNRIENKNKKNKKKKEEEDNKKKCFVRRHQQSIKDLLRFNLNDNVDMDNNMDDNIDDSNRKNRNSAVEEMA